MKGPNTSDRQRLERTSKHLEIAIVLAGAIVVIGLIGESRTLSAILVTVGVLAEVVTGIFITKNTERIQELANADVAAANERAANAERAAAEANLARVKLEREFAWRTLTNSDRELIRERLSQFQGQPFDFTPILSDPESSNFCEELRSALEYAGWIGRSGGAVIAGRTFPGIIIAVNRETPRFPAFLALVEVLNEIQVRGIAGAESANPTLMPTLTPLGCISVHVGRKPRREDANPAHA